MTTLQLSPIGGVPTPSGPGSGPAGEAVSSPTSTSKPDSSKPAQAKPSSTAATAAQAARASASTQSEAQQAAAAADARATVRAETPPLSLNVGIVGGTFDVYVDLTDPTDNRVVARLYGPKGGTPEPSHPAPTRVHTEA